MSDKLEGLRAFGGMLAYASIVPGIIVLALSVTFGWTVLTALLVLLGGMVALFLLSLVKALIANAVSDRRYKKNGPVA